MNFGRWLVALPVAFAAAFLAHLFAGITFGIGNGFEDVQKLLAATDMAGMPITGTFIIFFTRAITTAALVGALIYVVPNYKKQVAFAAVSIIIAFAVGLIGFVIYMSASGTLDISLGGWYRSILESVAYVLGGIAGFGVLKDAQRRA